MSSWISKTFKVPSKFNEELFLFCLTNYGESVVNSKLVWEVKMYSDYSYYIIYNKELALYFGLKYDEIG